jgi:hypothetical protein
MRLLRFHTLVLALSLSVSACGGSVAKSGGTSPAATEADGGGVCCPLSSQDPCAVCGGTGGGWAPSASACVDDPGPCDGYLAVVTDSHGCPLVNGGDDLPGAKCCGCPARDD